jgi:hypothetical protein
MKAAVLIQGDSRFCAEFDLFLNNLKGFDQVDYFMCLWKNNYQTANLLNRSGHQVVAESWHNLNEDWVLQKFKQELPAGHQVVKLQLVDQNTVPVHLVTENFAKETRQENVWKMFYSLYQANQYRVEHEKSLDFQYDMVIRTRPDVALMDPIKAGYLKECLDNDPTLVIIPKNKRCGYGGVFICDLFGIASSETMTVYCDLYNQALAHHASGTIFHPETLLGIHLRYNNRKFEPGNFNIEFRHLGKWRDINTGEEWPSTSVPSWDNKIYISEFGRWA